MSRVVSFPRAKARSNDSRQDVVEVVEIDASEGEDGTVVPSSDPAGWGMPRAFFLVRPSTIETVDSNTAC